ncbi:MAG TPA: FAD-linked oxidase C-terminal domain-containing protein [Solirubrobacteraceae bacterium]|jgi:glycolate oxidase subunit GlcD
MRTQTQTDPNLRRELARIVGDNQVLAGPEAGPYTHDATIQRGLSAKPDAVVRPADDQEIVAVLEWCYSHGVAIVPRGGGTGLAGGAVAVRGGVICSLERLNRVLGIEPQSWCMSVQAGVSTAHVKRVARENGLIFPPDPGAAEQSQIGGNVATNAAGPHAFKYGPTGAWVTGVDAALAPGRLASFGGTLRKDVCGYDIRSLLVGSEGTLGIITAVGLRLAPAPQLALGLVAFLDGLDSGARTVLELIGSGLQPAVLDFLDGTALAATGATLPGPVPQGAGFALLIELDGDTGEVERQLAELEEVLHSNGALAVLRPDAAELWRWRSTVNGAIAAQRGGKISEDICVPVQHLARASAEIHQIGANHGLPACAWGHAGDGIIHATFMVDLASPEQLKAALRAAEQVFELALELGGSVTGEHGIGWVKRGYMERQYGPGALDAHRRIKQALDPKGLLNPEKKDC